MLPRHIPLVARMERASHPDPWSENAFIEELQLPQSTTLVITARPPGDTFHGECPPFPFPSAHHNPVLEEEEILGYLCFWHVADEVQILNITVAPLHRGKGIGLCLMSHALQCAWERGANLVTLEVRKSNTAARELYRKTGFRTVGERPGYYTIAKESALIMIKDRTG